MLLSTAHVTVGVGGMIVTGATKSFGCALVTVCDVTVRGITCDTGKHCTPCKRNNWVRFTEISTNVFAWYVVCPLYTVYPAGKVIVVAAFEAMNTVAASADALIVSNVDVTHLNILMVG